MTEGPLQIERLFTQPVHAKLLAARTTRRDNLGWLDERVRFRSARPGHVEVVMTRPRVLLADDHRLLREAFTRLLEPTCEIVGSVEDGRALLEAAPRLEPDIVLLDIAMPLLNGLEAARQLKQSMPKLKLVFLTVSEDPDLAAECFRAGAAGFLLKNSAASELLEAIEDVYQGRSYVTPLLAQGLVESLIQKSASRQSGPRLSGRQHEVLQLLAEGHTMKEVARILQIKPRTVAFHKYTMMSSLGIRSNAELVQYAIQQRIVPGAPQSC
jgi:DNA-binding NarL/FixJ family response regulator